MAYFVLSMIEAFFNGILIVLASICISQATAYVSYAKVNKEIWSYLVIKDEHLVVIALNVIMIVCAAIHMIANILATVLICRSWWLTAAQKQSPMTVIYVAQNLSTNHMPTLCIEKGSRVTFLPTQSSADGMPNGTNNTNGHRH